jgi:hypothetical protein
MRFSQAAINEYSLGSKLAGPIPQRKPLRWRMIIFNIENFFLVFQPVKEEVVGFSPFWYYPLHGGHPEGITFFEGVFHHTGRYYFFWLLLSAAGC